MNIDIAGLSKAEKLELYSRLAYDIQEKEGAAGLPDELWSALCFVTQKEGKSTPTLKKFVSTFGKDRYLRCNEQMDVLLARATPKYCRKTVIVAVRRIMLECLVDHMGNRNIPITLSSVLNSFGMLKFAIDQSYPGYIEARLLDRVALAFS